MSDELPRVLIGAASPAGRAGLRALLEAGQVVGEVTPTTLHPLPEAEVLLLDAEFLQTLLAEAPGDGAALALVVLAGDGALETLLRLAPPGWALMAQDASRAEVRAAVLAAAAGLAALSPELAGRSLGRGAPPAQGSEPLTRRERDVLRLLALGHANKRIAAKLAISENTVKFHLAALYGKLGVSGRAGAVSEGVRRGLVSV